MANMSFQRDEIDLRDAIEIHKGKQLFLKHIAKMVILVQLPTLKTPGYSISNWEIMEKLKSSICPNLFSYIKVTKTSLEFLHFEAEAESKELLQKFINVLDGKGIKLSGIAEPLKVKAGRAKIPFPKKHDWIIFFRDSNSMDESKPGERPDTMHVKGLPIKWFANENKGTKEVPVRETVCECFENFGPVRNIDIPMLDKYRSRMMLPSSEDSMGFKTFNFGSNLYFDVFVQFHDYTGFEKAMLAFKGRKLAHILEDEKIAAATLIVDFDKTCHLSERNISRRELLRKRLIQHDEEQQRLVEKERLEEERNKEMERQKAIEEEKERQRKIEEEKQIKKRKEVRQKEKRKVSKLKIKFLREQKRKHLRSLEKQQRLINLKMKKDAKRLIITLLKIVSEKKSQEKLESRKRKKELKILHELERKRLKREAEEKLAIEEKFKQREALESKEKDLREKLIKSLQEIEETKEELQREQLRRKLSSGNEQLVSVVNCTANE
ncbi:A-kinase anchor protein 17A-like [Rhopilema esculentum]|uniref:A-kinase anchor protein 17A-like n=1 Tax=Rhopilema esculentum TaxID=499914 RepID=UPI0031DCC864|eukprot:gene251-9896_t